MSGFEIAGVVIGAIPLLVEGLQSYSKGIETLKSMKDFEIKFGDLVNDFAVAVSTYRNNCNEMLCRSSLGDETITKLLNGQNKTLWKRGDVQDHLRSQLGRDLEIYMKTMTKLDGRIVILAGKLKLNGQDFRPSWVSVAGVVDPVVMKKCLTGSRAKIMGGFQIQKFETLIQKIIQDILMLHRLQKSAVRVEPVRVQKTQQSGSLVTYLGAFRNQALRLFDTLNSHFYQCSCTSVHQADLQLALPQTDKRTANAGMRLSLEFTYPLTSGIPLAPPLIPPPVPPWAWRHVEIESEESKATTFLGCAGAGSLAAPSIVVTSSSRPSTPTPPEPVPTGDVKLDDLCKALAKVVTPQCCVGYLDNQPWKHKVYCLTTNRPIFHSHDGTSLYEILSKVRIGRQWRGVKFPPKERSMIALNLAYAVLQLHNTPWLQNSWNMDNIYVRHKDPKTQYINSIYVSRAFTSPSAQKSARRRRIIPNETVFSLGVAFIELAYGEPLSELGTDDDELQDEITEFETAKRLSEELYERESANFAEATRRCIRCDFDTRRQDLEDAEFRQKFYAGVIEPLREDYMQLYKPTG